MARVKQPRRTGHLLRQHQGRSPVARPDPDGKKPAPFDRVWSLEDDIRILEGLADHVAKHDKLPGRSNLKEALNGRLLDKSEYTVTEIYEKVRSLKKGYFTKRAASGARDDATEARKYELSTMIWGNEDAPEPAQPKLAKKHDTEPRGFEEMRCLYPCMSATVDGIAGRNNHGMLGVVFKRAFELMDDEQAVKLEAQVKKQRIRAAKLTIKRTTLTNQVLDTLIKSMD